MCKSDGCINRMDTSDHQPYFTILNSLQTKTHAPKYIIKTKQDPQSILNFEQEAVKSLLQ